MKDDTLYMVQVQRFPDGAEIKNLQTRDNLRDYFASQALPGIISANGTPAPDWERCAQDAYDLADAMLAQRAKKGDE